MPFKDIIKYKDGFPLLDDFVHRQLLLKDATLKIGDRVINTVGYGNLLLTKAERVLKGADGHLIDANQQLILIEGYKSARQVVHLRVEGKRYKGRKQ